MVQRPGWQYFVSAAGEVNYGLPVLLIIGKAIAGFDLNDPHENIFTYSPIDL